MRNRFVRFVLSLLILVLVVTILLGTLASAGGAAGWSDMLSHVKEMDFANLFSKMGEAGETVVESMDLPIEDMAESARKGMADVLIGDDTPEMLEETADGVPVYDAIYNGLASYQTDIELKFNVSTVDMDHLSSVFNRVLDDHPELFWLTGSGSWNGASYINRSVYVLSPVIESGVDMAALPQMQAEMNAVADEIVADAMQQDSTYNKALRVHDILVRTCDYDQEAAAIIAENMYADNTGFATTAYGALVRHTAVCGGYARAYKMLLNRMGIPCGYVTGTATNEQGTGSHAWNIVEIDGVTSYVDVTWDDPVGGDDYNVSRRYFCLSREEMMQDHTFDAG